MIYLKDIKKGKMISNIYGPKLNSKKKLKFI